MPRFKRNRYTTTAFLVAVVVAGLIAGVFTFSLGSILIWTALLLIALATMSKVWIWPNAVGPLLGWAWMIALIVFIVQLII